MIPSSVATKSVCRLPLSPLPQPLSPITPLWWAFIGARVVQAVPSHPTVTLSLTPASFFMPSAQSLPPRYPRPPTSSAFPSHRGHLDPSRSEHTPFTPQPGAESFKTSDRKENSFPLLSNDSSGSLCS